MKKLIITILNEITKIATYYYAVYCNFTFMKKLLFLFLVLQFTFAKAQSEKVNITKINTFPFQAEQFIGFDSYQFYYFIENNVLHRIKDHKSLEYKNISLGKITQVIIENPLKIILFYGDFNTIIILDNQLNEIQKINLTENNIPIIASSTGIAVQNQLWIYDSLNQQIGLYNYLKNSFRYISTSFPDQSKYEQSDFNNFYWIDKKNNWYSCDIFGKINLIAKIPDFEMVKILNEKEYIYFKNGNFFYVDVNKKEIQQFEILEKTFKNFYYKDQILAIFTSEGIINYKITTP